MSVKISDWAVNRPVAVMMAVLAVLILGMVSLTGLNMDLMPELNMPVAVTITSYPGAGPQEVEAMVTRPLEGVLGTVNNVNKINSTSMAGTSVVIAQFSWGTDMNFATLQMREKVDMVKRYLPPDVDTPMVLKMDPSLMPVLQLSVTGEMSQAELKALVENTIKPRLERVEGVASVGVSGGLTREIQVHLLPEKLHFYGISINQVIQALQMDNITMSGGQVRGDSRELLVRVTGQFTTVDDVGNVAILSPGGTRVKIKDLARVEDGFKDVSQISRLNGQPSLGLSIQKQTNANPVRVVRAVRAALSDMQTELPGNLEVATVLDQAEFIEKVINNVARNIAIGGVLAMLVLFIFLRNIRSTLVIALSMPISIIATFTLVYFGGLTLNIMTLGGLALGVGMMVDNSIVVLENIFRHRQEGMGMVEAAKTGTSEVTGAIAASTMTTIAVFFPMVFVQGMASQLFRPMALTVTFALVASLLVALSLLPMLSSRMLRVPPVDVNGQGNGNDYRFGHRLFRITGRWLQGLDHLYRRVLAWSLTRRSVVIGAMVLGLAGSVALVPTLGTEFIPGMDRGEISINITMPVGTSLMETNKVAVQVEEMVRGIPEVQSVFTVVGSATGNMGGLSIGTAENARLDLRVTPKSAGGRPSEIIVEEIRQQVEIFPGAKFAVSAGDIVGHMGAFMAPIEVIIRGDDLGTLKSLAEQAINRIRQVEGIREVTSSMEEGRPEIQVIIDRERAAAYALNPVQIASATRAAVQGQVATRYRTGAQEIEVRVRLTEEAREDIAALERLAIASPMGFQVPLKEVARLEVAQGPASVERRDQARAVVVSAVQASDRDLGSVVRDVEKAMAGISLPPGYTVDYGGQTKEMREAFGNLTLALALAIILVYMVMAAQFESLIHPFTIMFSMPVAAIGVVVSLAVTDRPFGITAFIGIIMLAGIVVNNAIVLVDYINQLRRRGIARDEAILKAGPTRLRPILMTALTTILGLVPLAIGLGEGAEAQAPMATVVIGGLLFSTLLTLVLVPVVYTIFDDFGRRFAHKFGR